MDLTSTENTKKQKKICHRYSFYCDSLGVFVVVLLTLSYLHLAYKRRVFRSVWLLTGTLDQTHTLHTINFIPAVHCDLGKVGRFVDLLH